VKRSSIDVGDDVYKKILDAINALKLRPGTMYAIQSEFQADSTLAAAINHNNAEIVLFADSDLAALLGDNCIAIKKYTFIDKSRMKSLKDIEIFCSDYSTISMISSLLNLPNESKITPIRPVFEGIKNMNVRCLIAVGLGCDVYVPGVPTVTAKVVFDFINKLKKESVHPNDYYNMIIKKYVSIYNTQRKRRLYQLIQI
jgi:hypothetical protein